MLKEGAKVFANSVTPGSRGTEAKEAELHEQIGRLKMELEWLKKNLPAALELKRQLIEPNHPALSLRQQCQLIDLNCSSWYYQPAGESEYNLLLMRLIDEQYTETPFYDWPRMTAQLRRQGHQINGKRVRRLALAPAAQAQVSPGATRSGLPISPTSGWLAASCIWWRFWTGLVVTCWLGSFPTPWTDGFARLRFSKRCAWVAQRSLTPKIIGAVRQPEWRRD